MKTPSALVTGATGFIGSNLVKSLLLKGWNVSVLVRESSDDRNFDAGVRVITDLATDASGDLLMNELRNTAPDIVFHLASLFQASHLPADIPKLIESNVTFGTRLLEAMKRAGITKFINTGSAWQHFEASPDTAVNLYAATKSAFEAIVSYYASASNISANTLMLYDTYGMGDPRAKLVHLLTKFAKSGEHLAMSKGEQQINLVHVDDVVRAFLLSADCLMTSDHKPHERFYVSSERTLSLRELVQVFESSTATKLDIGWGERPYREREVMKPFSKGLPVPGWLPLVKLKDGFRSVFDGTALK